MGLSSLPSPSEGVLSVVLVNMALSVSIFKEILRSILHLVGIHLPQPSDLDDIPFEPLETPPFADEFRRRFPVARFRSIFRSASATEHHECSICLARFEPESGVNRTPCGHFFHVGCLDKWMGYWNTTCPLCRTPIIQE